MRGVKLQAFNKWEDIVPYRDNAATPVRQQHSLDSDHLSSFLKDFAVIHRIPKLPLCQNEEVRETKEGLAQVYSWRAVLLCTQPSHREWRNKPWERQLWAPQLDMERDAPSCSPLLKHTSSFLWLGLLFTPLASLNHLALGRPCQLWTSPAMSWCWLKVRKLCPQSPVPETLPSWQKAALTATRRSVR